MRFYTYMSLGAKGLSKCYFVFVTVASDILTVDLGIKFYKSPIRFTFSYVFILKFVLCMFRKNTPFNISSLRITVYTAVVHC